MFYCNILHQCFHLQIGSGTCLGLVAWVGFLYVLFCGGFFCLFSASLRYNASAVLDCNPGVFTDNILLSLVVNRSNLYLALSTLFGLLSAPVWT